MSEIEERFRFARTLAKDAGALAMQHFVRRETIAIGTKADGQDIVSEADHAVEDLIRAAIGNDFPEDGILGEERGHEPGTSGWTWVVDPIDGTACFVSGLRDWCISVAAMKEGEVEVGVILQPATGDLYEARRGGGATLNGQPIRVNGEARIGSHLLGFGASFRVPRASVTAFADALIAAGGMFYRNGSGALMLAYVAAGRLAGYYEGHINAWDCMAGLLLVREAGGWTADFPGAGRTLVEGGAVVAGAPGLREELMMLIDRSGLAS